MLLVLGYVGLAQLNPNYTLCLYNTCTCTYMYMYYICNMHIKYAKSTYYIHVCTYMYHLYTHVHVQASTCTCRYVIYLEVTTHVRRQVRMHTVTV